MQKTHIYFTFVWLYIISMSVWILNDDGFHGVRMASFFVLWMALPLSSYMNVCPIRDGQEKSLLRSYIFIYIIFPLIIAIQGQIFTVFTDFEQHSKGVKTELVRVEWLKGLPANRFSSGGGGIGLGVLDESQKYKNGDLKELLPACSVLLKNRYRGCDYLKDKVGETMLVSYVKMKDSYFFHLKFHSLIYEIKSLDSDFYLGKDYYIAQYQLNKKYLLYVLFFVMLGAMLIQYIGYYLLEYKRIENDLEYEDGT